MLHPNLKKVACAGSAGRLGTFMGATRIKGDTGGVTPQLATCVNRRTGQEVRIELDGQTGWDCVRAGLVVSTGDKVTQIIRAMLTTEPIHRASTHRIDVREDLAIA